MKSVVVVVVVAGVVAAVVAAVVVAVVAELDGTVTNVFWVMSSRKVSIKPKF